MTPLEALQAQAAHCRRAWRALGPEAVAAWPVPGDDAIASTWRRILARDHPVAVWLDGDAPFEALPASYDAGPSPRQLFSSHPFTGWHPWSSRLTFTASSSTPPGS
jgi:hypothetical protein